MARIVRLARENPRIAQTARAAADVAVDDPRGVLRLLDSLGRAGAHEQIAVLLARDPAAHVALDDPFAVVWLPGSLREAGAHEQHTTLADRLPTAGQFDTFLDIDDYRERFAFGREPDGSPAAPWTWDDLQ
ncbi:hypothetical protein Aple_100480 [Acrocarpospora pleiomorpha]|uniref:Uncharacterized protein n=1 Tax=Acrocarpospora pleiomorpha TaxID=90975 RepID=A0A5M3Y431_9ACTN|nr:hypothetical protein [Acrocarpospora pleiomorpha]GES27149.1 hypothetical protein Aple_100480 [Acrocarpospora pleiomorpha]